MRKGCLYVYLTDSGFIHVSCYDVASACQIRQSCTSERQTLPFLYTVTTTGVTNSASDWLIFGRADYYLSFTITLVQPGLLAELPKARPTSGLCCTASYPFKASQWHHTCADQILSTQDPLRCRSHHSDSSHTIESLSFAVRKARRQPTQPAQLVQSTHRWSPIPQPASTTSSSDIERCSQR